MPSYVGHAMTVTSGLPPAGRRARGDGGGGTLRADARDRPRRRRQRRRRRREGERQGGVGPARAPRRPRREPRLRAALRSGAAAARTPHDAVGAAHRRRPCSSSSTTSSTSSRGRGRPTWSPAGEPDVEPVRRGARGGQAGRRGERRAPRPAVPDGAGGPRLWQRLKAALLAVGLEDQRRRLELRRVHARPAPAEAQQRQARAADDQLEVRDLELHLARVAAGLLHGQGPATTGRQATLRAGLARSDPRRRL